MRRAVILGIGSEIGKGIAARLERDGVEVVGLRHNEGLAVPITDWDLLVCCYGTLEPIGPIWRLDPDAIEQAFAINFFAPVHRVMEYYPCRTRGASVCFFSGAGANGPAPTYAAYCTSKIALTKMVECMDSESEDCKFFILGPGMVRTKIQQQSLDAGPGRAANYARVREFMDSGVFGTPLDDIYACLRACAAAPKSVVGGRNIYVPLDDWGRLEDLEGDMFKLRRAGDTALRGV